MNNALVLAALIEGVTKEALDDDNNGDTPVTLTLYHFVKLGGHSNFDVILLSGPSLITAE